MTEQEAREAWQHAGECYDRSDFAAAMPLYETALTVFTEQTHPQEWASLQNSLGISLVQLPTGDRAYAEAAEPELTDGGLLPGRIAGGSCWKAGATVVGSRSRRRRDATPPM